MLKCSAFFSMYVLLIQKLPYAETMLRDKCIQINSDVTTKKDLYV